MVGNRREIGHLEGGIPRHWKHYVIKGTALWDHDNQFFLFKASQKFTKLTKLKCGWTHNIKRKDHLLEHLKKKFEIVKKKKHWEFKLVCVFVHVSDGLCLINSVCSFFSQEKLKIRQVVFLLNDVSMCLY